MEHELVAAAAREARSLTERADGAVRKRLLVLAHALELAERELDATTSEPDDAELAAAIRDGRHDDNLIGLTAGLRASVRDRLAVATPGYDRTD